MSEIRASYTVIKGGPLRRVLYYRGAIRRRSDDGVIWECDHEHETPGVWSNSATPCAQQELRRREPATRPREHRGEGSDGQ